MKKIEIVSNGDTTEVKIDGVMIPDNVFLVEFRHEAGEDPILNLAMRCIDAKPLPLPVEG